MHPGCLRSTVERRDAEGTTDQEAAWNGAGHQETPTTRAVMGVVSVVLHCLQGQAEPASSGLIIRDLIHRCLQIHPGTETFS